LAGEFFWWRPANEDVAASSALDLQFRQNPFVCGSKGQPLHLCRCFPDPHVYEGMSSASPKKFGRRKTPPSDLYFERFERDAITRDGMSYRAKCFKCRWAGAEDGLENVPGVGAIGFSVWEFPQLRIDDTGWPLLHEETAVSFHNKRHEPPRARSGPFAEIGQFPDAIVAEGDTEFFHRANLAP
jgi:hypothetical protein